MQVAMLAAMTGGGMPRRFRDEDERVSPIAQTDEGAQAALARAQAKRDRKAEKRRLQRVVRCTHEALWGAWDGILRECGWSGKLKECVFYDAFYLCPRCGSEIPPDAPVHREGGASDG